MALFQPAPLQKGDRVALIAPSGPLPEGRLPLGFGRHSRERTGAGGLSQRHTNARLSCGCGRGSRAGRQRCLLQTIRSRACSAPAAGYGAQRLYPRIDWENIRRHPKRFWDTATSRFFHLMLTQRCGMVSYHTPMPSTGVV